MPDKTKLRIVVVGCGGISRAWFATVRERDDVEIVALVDIKEASARERAEQFGLEEVSIYTDPQTAIQETGPDAVFDITTPDARLNVVGTALDMGCHVLSEKPMADSLENANKLVELAKRSGKTFAVMQNRRYTGPIRRVRSFLDSGELGPLTTVHSDFFLGMRFGGFRAEMRHVLLVDMAVHTFDALRFVSNGDVRSVFAHDWNPQGSTFSHGASAVAFFEMTDDMIGTYRGSWCSQGLPTTWESDWRFICRNGTLLWDGGDGVQAEKVVEEDGKPQRVSVDVPHVDFVEHHPEAHAGCIHDFVESVKRNKTPETVCTDNINTLAMVYGAVKSAEEERKVNIGRENGPVLQ